MVREASCWLVDGGAMGALIRAYNWKHTPVGALDDWPQNLRTCLQTVLNARPPMAICWGRELHHFYNDTYAHVMLGKHWQCALGRAAAEVWRERWRELGPLAKRTLRTGRPERTNTFSLTLERDDFREEGYRRISYSALPGERGEAAGVLCCVTVETQNVVSRRREDGLHSLSISTMTARSIDEAWRASVAALAQLSDDLPFFLLYAADPAFNGGFLVGAGHIADGTAGSPRIFDLDDAHAPWPFREAYERRRSIVMEELPRGLVFLEGGRPEPLRRAVLLPIICAGEVIGFAITGLNPRQPFDEDYRKFLESLASYLACAIASARAFEEQRRQAETLADTEAQHRASEEHLRLALEVGPVGTWEWDPGRETVIADAAHQSLFGLTPEPGPRPLELYRARMFSDDFAVGIECAKAAVQKKSTVRHEHRVRLPDGQTRWLLSLGRAKRGDPACMIGISLDMTERRRMEEELRRSEVRLRAAVDLLGLGLYDWDPRTDALKWDARVKAMWGLPPHAHVDYEVWRAHVHPGDLDRVLTAINRSVDARGDGLYDIDYRVIGADGVERWVRTRAHTTFGKDGPEAFTGVALDITERKKAEQRLLEDEARLSAILAQLPIGVGLVDREGRFLLRGGLLGHLWDDAMPSADPRERDRWRAFDADGHSLASESYPGARALRGETIVPGLDFIHTSETGHETWIRVAAVPFRDMNGEIKGAVSILEDIDCKKRAEQEIRESEQRFREFSEHSTQVIWILSARERCLEYLSPAYERIWGKPRELCEGYWAETIHPEDQDAAVAALDRVVLGETIVREYRVIRPDGRMRSVRDTLFPMRGGHRRVERIGGISQDITVHTEFFVYLVDSEERSRADVQRLLMKAGYRVKSFGTGSEFLAVAPVLALGCVILDVRSPRTGGLAVARQLKATGSHLPVLVAGASQGDISVAVQAMKAGAVEWIETPCDEAVLLGAVASALADVRAIAEQNRQVTRVRSQIASMTERERQVLEGLLAGGTNKTIGRDLGISPRTVELYRASVMEKLGAQSLTQAVLLTATAGILPTKAAGERGLVRKHP